jgi:predicted DNA-binding transcriptional regulator YafY
MSESKRGTNQKRLLAILRVLLEGERLDRYSVATQFGCTPQTAHRLLSLVAAELPIKTDGKQGRRRTYEFDRSRFEATPSLAEALAACFSASFAPLFGGTQYAEQLRQAREQSISRLASSRKKHFRDVNRKFIVLATQAATLEGRSEELEEVLDGVLRQHVLSVRYRRFDGRVQALKLRPYSIAISSGALYVIAPERGGSLHPFRFDRLESVESTSDTFEYPGEGVYDPGSLFRHSVGVFLDFDVREVRIRMADRWRSFLRTHRWHSSQIVVDQPDGSVELQLVVRACPELERWILGFGTEAEVIAPAQLRDRITEVSRDLARIYTRDR